MSEKEYKKEIHNLITKNDELKVVIDTLQTALRTSEKYLRPNEVNHLLGDYSKAKSKLDWAPETSFDELVKLMVDEDLILAEKEKVLIDKGLLEKTWEN